MLPPGMTEEDLFALFMSSGGDSDAAIRALLGDDADSVPVREVFSAPTPCRFRSARRVPLEP